MICISHAFSQFSTHQDTDDSFPFLLHSEHMQVNSYLESLLIDTSDHISGSILDITDNFPDHFVKAKDIDSLLTFVKSKQKCKCALSPLSSYIPFKDTAELGGYAIDLIRSYKIGKKYSIGLYSCPHLDEKEAESLLRWWRANKKHAS